MLLPLLHHYQFVSIRSWPYHTLFLSRRRRFINSFADRGSLYAVRLYRVPCTVYRRAVFPTCLVSFTPYRSCTFSQFLFRLEGRLVFFFFFFFFFFYLTTYPSKTNNWNTYSCHMGITHTIPLKKQGRRTRYTVHRTGSDNPPR